MLFALRRWIWVEGFKGTKSDMQCRSFQYELGKEYEINGDPVDCEHGFHFCKELEYVFRYYAYDFSNRFFKVKAMVNKDSWEKCSDKYVAKKIILTEEIDLTYEELIQMGVLHSRSSYHNYIYTFMPKDLFEVKKADPSQNGELKWYIDKMTEIGHSEAFALTLIENRSYNWTTYVETYNKAAALSDEGLSKDMRAYLILQYQKDVQAKIEMEHTRMGRYRAW